MLWFGVVPRRGLIALGIVLASSTILACNQREHPPPFQLAPATTASGGQDPSGGLDVVDAGLDAALCGNQQIPAIIDPPNLYFVVDRSFSMNDFLPSGLRKYEAAYTAIGVMLRVIGHRVRYGAAVFPDFLDPLGCSPGGPAFPVTAGDPPSYAAKGESGPVLLKLIEMFENHPPEGATPTAETLRELEPDIIALPGKKTYVVLLTDGAPNCHPDLRCGVEGCIPNIEHIATTNGMLCDASLNCCDPLIGGACVDADDTEAAVRDYEQAGVDTYVVGMPGSEAYGAILGRLAIAGNTARAGTTPYYAVSDTDELTFALRSIGAQVAISCDLPLSEAPEDPELVNVYFDDEVVPSNGRDGWHFTGDQSIQFRGAACAKLGSGDVLNVQVLTGCPTVVR